jgi:pyruvate formate lyase activating enzyme
MRTCEKKAVKGKIHSVETFGTHEGPGIRLVVFLQGCRARCLYCHNPDTWKIGGGQETDAHSIFSKLRRCLPYINASGGGITVSGGEPLMQLEFLEELFTLCREGGIHTAVDTAGFFDNRDTERLKRVLGLTDLFIVDLKAADDRLFKRITARELKETRGFIDLLESSGKEYWLRYVLVPGLNDSEESILGLSRVLKGLGSCKHFEFLPYHTLGRHKWEHMGMEYPLEGTRPATDRDVKRATKILKI